ncbi:inactive rhomboid protein 1 [Drosophila pseudoobscura]|uniref:Inactive rhomboid protein 1 n=1 Tax=Drosophila pseudoobscura pseudoobscura TaxID=46245 RepID=A0A6I8W0S7_DROPS|nr:inactive rhomboid protein 1 [Drosophila pseudoobscura]
MTSSGEKLSSNNCRTGKKCPDNVHFIMRANGNISISQRKSVNSQNQFSLTFESNECDVMYCSLQSSRLNAQSSDAFQPNAGKLKLSPLEKIDDANTAAPPSPAPNNDGFEACVNQLKTHTCNVTISKSDNHALVPKHGIGTTSYHQRGISPNSRYRLERYKEAKPAQQPKLLEAVNVPSTVPSVSSTRLLLPSNVALPMGQCENYNAYLGSAVHTPVKRYVPTPPPAIDMYAGLTLQASSANMTPPASSVQPQYGNMPYNYRSKCCHNGNVESMHGSLTKPSQTYVASVSCSTSCTSPLPAPSTSISMAFSAGNHCSPIMTATAEQTIAHSSDNSHITSRRSEESDSLIVIAPGTTIAQLEADSPAGTCMHCNTARRTTGVHQTTQTTGPISPVPISLSVPMTAPVISSLSEQLANTNTESSIVSVQTKLHDSRNIALKQGSSHHQLYGPGTAAAFSHLISNPRLQHTHHTQTHQHQSLQILPQPQIHHYSCKKRIVIYLKRTTSQFFGVEPSTEAEDCALWHGRHRRLAIRRFGLFDSALEYRVQQSIRHGVNVEVGKQNSPEMKQNCSNASSNYAQDRPDILPVQDAIAMNMTYSSDNRRPKFYTNRDFCDGEFVERKASVGHMFITMVNYLLHFIYKRQTKCSHRVKHQWQWSRSFAPLHVQSSSSFDPTHNDQPIDIEISNSMTDALETIIVDELFFDSPCEVSTASANDDISDISRQTIKPRVSTLGTNGTNMGVGVSVYMTERHQNGWRTSALISNACTNGDINLNADQNLHQVNAGHIQLCNSIPSQIQPSMRTSQSTTSACQRGTRITAQLLDGVLENSRRTPLRRIKYFSVNDLDDRTDHRPIFTYWINTVQFLVLVLSIICYGIAPIGIGSEQKTGQVLVTSLSLQTVQHVEQRNLWIGPRNIDLVHIGAKFAACMRRDSKIMDVVIKTRRHERETACCIRNDDSGCVQSSQADCSIRGLYPTKSISTWKKWSPGESGPGGRISGSVCGLDPKFCDAPASIAPYEWPDDITKWPICRKTNSFTQRYRYKDHTSEHMVCEVIGHPCCTGLYGECRITTREYCDFINGYFHEEASLCSQISCLNNVCGMLPFISVETPDQLYRLLTSLCMHAGILHLAITLIFQHLFLADLEKLIGTLRTAVVYIVSGFAGNLTSAIIVPHRPEVGPSASLCGVVSSLIALLIWMHWKCLHKPHIALFKLLLLCSVLVGIGTLPYQLNFVGLLAGVACGGLLTMTLVPFTTFSKYGRKKKIKLIWTCLLFHVVVYSGLIATFYIHPSEFHTISIVDIFSNSNGYDNVTNSDHHGVDVISSTTRYTEAQNPQFYYHHHSDDIIRNSVAFTERALVSHIIYPSTPRKASVQQWQKAELSRSLNNFTNYSNIKKSIEHISNVKKMFTLPVRLTIQNNHSNLMTELTTVNTKMNQKYLGYINNTKEKSP